MTAPARKAPASQLVVHGVEQRSPEWHQLRCGLPTASEFKSVLAGGLSDEPSKMRRSYMCRLAGEIITGDPQATYKNADMERGNEMEAEARDHYAFTQNAHLTRVGFVTNGRKGCSPDSLIGDDGALEIKTMKPDLLVEQLLKGEFPPAHKAQCQGTLWVCEREWIDLCIYWPKMPMFRKRAVRDELYIRKLADAVSAFTAELDELVERIKRMGGRR